MTPSILDTFLAAHTALTRATAAEVEEASRIDDELQQLPAGGYPLARSMLTERAADVQVRLVTARRAIVSEYAALLCLRTGNDGECAIDKPAIRPKGPPTRAERAARSASVPVDRDETPPAPETPAETGTAAAEDAPPADDASGLAAAFELANEWASCDIGKARGHANSVLGYTADELVGLGDVQIRAICKHRVGPAEFGGVVVGGVIVDGVAWLLEAPARVVTP